MRLFVALDLPDFILNALDALVKQLKPTAPIHWSNISSLHITTKFIGEWPDARLPEMKSALASVPHPGALTIHIEDLGWFPGPQSPRVFWAGIRASGSLENLAHETDKATAALGVPAETRKFHPHLTLARIKQSTGLAALQQAIAKLDSLAFGEFTAQSQFLYQSKLGPSGSVYTKLAEFPLS